MTVVDINVLEKRIADLKSWLEENAPEYLVEQRHLNEGTRERVYWHYGYMVALRDVLAFLTDDHRPNRIPYSVDTSN